MEYCSCCIHFNLVQFEGYKTLGCDVLKKEITDLDETCDKYEEVERVNNGSTFSLRGLIDSVDKLIKVLEK